MICPRCSSETSDITDRCSTCQADVGFPNVRAAAEKTEVDALSLRYTLVTDEAVSRGSGDALIRFEANMRRTCAVINVHLRFLFHFLTSDNALYSTYQLGVRGEARKPATRENDRHRVAVDSLMFGSYGEKIRYAALSLDGVGPKSYGPYSIRLKEITISARASLLDENSYFFVSRHGVEPGKALPLGHRSTWEDRYKLAVAKLAPRILPTTDGAEHASLLFSGTSRSSDEFIEVHIYGSLDQNTIESVSGNSATKNSIDAALLTAIKEHLSNLGRKWIER